MARKTASPDVRAIHRVASALEGLTEGERRRVLTFFIDRSPAQAPRDVMLDDTDKEAPLFPRKSAAQDPPRSVIRHADGSERPA